MVALNETNAEPSSRRRIARGCRVAATYPQGGTGIPAGEINCPGAAAHMQPAAATGFRAVGATNGFGSPPNVLNINGANTYQFVGSDPVAAGAWGMEHATDTSYITRINGKWFVWQSCRNQAVRIVDVGPGGQAVGTASTPLPSTAPLFERP